MSSMTAPLTSTPTNFGSIPSEADITDTPWQQITAVDGRILALVQRLHHPLLTRGMGALTHLGDGGSWTLIAALLISFGGGGARVGYHLAAAAVMATILAQAIKRLVRRRRPSDLGHGVALVENPDPFSFPSGHTAAAFAVAVALTPSGAGSVLFALAGAIAVSRVYLGVHYPLDVGAGTLIGVVSGAAVLAF